MSGLSYYNHSFGFPYAEHPIRDREAATAATWWYRMLDDWRQATDDIADRDGGDWANLTGYTNSWTPTPAGAQAYPSWRKINGQIVLRGQVTGGTAGSILKLPDDAAPDVRKLFACVAGVGVARVDVTTDGLVTLQSYRLGGSNSFIVLDSIQFWAQ